ncbi:acetylornithine transaminase [uncultured Actinomyces sp.]|uniref:acetylornithine transaminase n=1 Tax=uncultured Actinomyces sp. TaxID=249061 RepID=UPI0025E49442|nr:acetylornithine transaminase [uncultured Actinomyces sp.]
MTAFPGPDSSAPAPATDSTGLGTDTVAGTVSGDGTTGATWLDRYTDAVMNTFGTPGRVLVRGQGVHLWDADGKEYTDLLAGIAVNCLGHAHPAIVEAVTTQLSTLGHVSNFFTTPAQVRLAEELISLTLPGRPVHESRVFLANSGTEANEAAFKIARRHGGGSRPRVLALQDAFHGRTMGALALTHKAAYREPFEPLPGGVEFIPAGDIEALRGALGPDVAALIVEPIQGEAGVRELPAGYLEAARELTEAVGALLIIDEVQSGMGRSGAWMAHHLLAPGVVPDVVTLAKGLGGGIPIGAVVATGEAAALLGPGQHGTTFGGNPVACAAALAVIDTVRSQDLLVRVEQLGSAWVRELAAVDGVNEVRGRGLLIGVGLAEGLPPAGEIAATLLAERGFIVNAPRPDTIRLAPPFILSDDDAGAFTTALSEILSRAQSEKVSS